MIGMAARMLGSSNRKNMPKLSEILPIKVLLITDKYNTSVKVKKALYRGKITGVSFASDLRTVSILLERDLPDAAVLDLNLRGSDTQSIYRVLLANSVPTVFLIEDTRELFSISAKNKADSAVKLSELEKLPEMIKKNAIRSRLMAAV